MSRMMPGRIRQEGIDLYEAGQLVIKEQEAKRLHLDIAGEQFTYAADDSQMACSCQFFGQRGYCVHLAATEYFLKNDPEGQNLTASLETEQVQEQEEERQKSLGSQFLDRILIWEETSRPSYLLEAEGQFGSLERQLLWTLKIRRLPDERSYIVRDIKAFLKSLDTGQSYQIGKNYYEPIDLQQFDRASQELLNFLKRLVPDTIDFDAGFFLPNMGRHLKLSQGFFEEGLILLQGLSQFSLTLDNTTYTHIQLEDLSQVAPLFDFKVDVQRAFMELSIQEVDYRIFFQGAYLFYQGTFFHLDARQLSIFKVLKDLFKEGSKQIQMNFEDKDRLSLLLLDLGQMGRVQAPKQFKIHDFRAFFEFTRLDNDWIQLEIALDFDRIWVANAQQLEALPFSIHYQHLKTIWSLLEEHGFGAAFKTSKRLIHSQDFYDFYTVTLPAFEEVGEVVLTDRIRESFSASKTSLYVDRTDHFLDVQFDFQDIPSEEISAAYEALQADRPYYVTQSGRLMIFDQETKAINQRLKALKGQVLSNGSLRLSSLAALQVTQTLEGKDGLHISASVKDLVEHLRQPASFDLPPLGIKAQLRDYQILGVKWLSMLAHYGLGGILADDMGLGKTLQTIAFLSQSLKEGQRALILAPSSLIYNWQDEFKRFASQMDVAVSYGSKPQRLELLASQPQIVVTSYASFRQDFEDFQTEEFQVLILDEAQVMKNDQTKIASYLRQFKVGTCFALSGTPIENRLVELWSIFQIVLPDLLPDKRAFNQLPAKEVSRIIKPFVLRRRKEEVLAELPALLEINQINELTDSQKAIYLAQIQQLRDSLSGASDSEINRKKIEILSAITRLRQICNTPKLFMEDYDGDSGKLESLRQLLTQIQESGHRVLIFSQFRGMLDLIEKELEELGLSSYKITGSTKADDRQEITRAFNAGSRDAVLISLKAGGVGINLTGADTVILVDLWWNPAVEDQAISRAYRMGQERNVECYRLITRGSIEEKIQELQASKRQLITTVLDGQESRSSLSAEDIREILGLS